MSRPYFYPVDFNLKRFYENNDNKFERVKINILSSKNNIMNLHVLENET